MTQEKLKKLKKLIEKACKLELAYASIMGSGRTEFIALYSVFKWPDVVNSLIAAAYEGGDESQVIEDVSVIIIHIIQSLAAGFADALKLRPEELASIQKTIPVVNKNDIDAVLAWHDKSLDIVKKLAKTAGVPHLEETL